MSNLPFTQSPAEPHLKDVLDQLKKNIFLSFNCHHVGTVQQFNEENQTATVTINYKKTYYKLNRSSGIYSPTLIDYPVLAECPVIVLGGGPAALTFPIEAGDECLILFNDRDLDTWFQGGTGGAVATPRLYSFADGIVLVGLRSLANSLDEYDLTRAVLKYGSTLVGVGESLVKIANEQYTLNELLQELISEIKNLTDQTAALTVTGISSGGQTSGPPANALAIAAISLQITATATKIGALLE